MGKKSNVVSVSMTSRSKSPITLTQTEADSPSCPTNGSSVNSNGIATQCKKKKEIQSVKHLICHRCIFIKANSRVLSTMVTVAEVNTPLTRAGSGDDTDTAKPSSSSKIASFLMTIEIHSEVFGLSNALSNTPPM